MKQKGKKLNIDHQEIMNSFIDSTMNASQNQIGNFNSQYGSKSNNQIIKWNIEIVKKNSDLKKENRELKQFISQFENLVTSAKDNLIQKQDLDLIIEEKSDNKNSSKTGQN